MTFPEAAAIATKHVTILAAALGRISAARALVPAPPSGPSGMPSDQALATAIRRGQMPELVRALKDAQR